MIQGPLNPHAHWRIVDKALKENFLLYHTKLHAADLMLRVVESIGYPASCLASHQDVLLMVGTHFVSNMYYGMTTAL